MNKIETHHDLLKLSTDDLIKLKRREPYKYKYLCSSFANSI